MGLKLMAEIGLDGSGFERGLRKVGSEAASSVKNLAVQAFGIYGVEQAIAKTVETATELVNESKRLDVTVEQLQLLRQAAKDGGTEMGTLASAFEKLDIARAKALNGDKNAIAAFAKLGVNQSALKTQTAATLFTGQISNSVKNGNVENLAPMLREVLGKGFGEIIPVLKTDFDELGGKMKRLGSIMDTDTAVRLKYVGDEFSLLSTIMTTQLAPAIIFAAENIYKAFAKLSGVFSGLGAGTSNWTIKDWVMALNPITSGVTIATKFDAKAAGEAYVDTSKPLLDELEAVKKKLQEEADKIKNPKPIVPEVSETPAKKSKSEHLEHMQTDALVRVGNFLGSTGNTISRVDQRKIDLLNKIVENTKPQQGQTLFGYGVPLV